MQSILSEKGFKSKLKGAAIQLYGFGKEKLGTKYCTIKFSFIKGSEYSRNYQWINNESLHIPKIVFQIEADNMGNVIDKICFLKKNDYLEVHFSAIGSFKYVVERGLINQLFNLGHN